MSTQPLQEFDRASKAYADARAAADAIVTNLNEAVEALKRDHVKALKIAFGRAVEQHDRLKALILEYPDLFAKPKTQTMNGLRFGLMKAADKVELVDEDTTIDMIESALPEMAPVLIDTKKSVRKAGLAKLTDEQLATIACQRVPGADEPFVKPVDSEVEKFVSKMIGAAIKED